MPRKKKKINRYQSVRVNLRNFKTSDKITIGKKQLEKLNKLIVARPFTTFFSALLVLLLLIILGNILLAPKADIGLEAPVKTVEVYKLGSAPKIKVSAQVEKSGVIKIVALAPGIVSSINVLEGNRVRKGANLISLVSNYSNVNILALSAQIAGNQYRLAMDTFDAQKELIAKQKDVANKSNDNSEKLREISSNSASDTKSLLDINQSLLDKVNADLQSLNATNSGGLSNPLIYQTTQVKSQLQSATTQLKSQLRSLEYQSAGDKPPAELANLQKEITLKQLEIQEKSLAVNLETARLQYNLALTNAEIMHPTAPFPGAVDRIYVKVGQFVNSGNVLLSLSGTEQHLKIIAKVSFATAKNISLLEESIINLNGKIIAARPSYISQDATDGQLYSVIYQLDDSYKALTTDSSFVTVGIPVGTGDTNNSVPFVPLDAIFQTQDEAFIFVAKNNTAESVKLRLGQVQGKFVEVISGLSAESTVILTRNVVDGDIIEIK